MQQLDLSGLKDVHIPDAINTFWPLAPGWWMLIVLMIVIPLIIYIFRYYRLRSAKHYALTQLDLLADSSAKDTVNFAEEVSKLLRRIAILKYGKDKVSSLSEIAWVKFLNQNGNFALDPKLTTLFAYAPYAKGQVLDKATILTLRQTAINWINKNA